jgi:hypothetical protein
MVRLTWCSVSAVFVAALFAGCGLTQKMNFFVTSVPSGDGGNVGGLAGAVAISQKLAPSVVSTTQLGGAYLCTTADGEHGAVNARDRIGHGPWFNAKGVQVAATLEDLHGSRNQLGGRTSLDEHGNFVLANVHDILTGSQPDGTVAPGDATCHNWTSTAGHAMVGHSNKVGSIGGDRARSWNSAHLSEGCTRAELQKLGGGALLYCFAVD